MQLVLAPLKWKGDKWPNKRKDLIALYPQVKEWAPLEFEIDSNNDAANNDEENINQLNDDDDGNSNNNTGTGTTNNEICTEFAMI